MSAQQKTPCDCTVYCGDDPWLQSGRAVHCQPWLDKKKEIDAQMARQKALDALPDKLLASLKDAYVFIVGFEDDDAQEGINDLLASIHKTITEAESLL